MSSRKLTMWNLQQLRHAGLEPTEARIIVVKSAIAYRAAYLPIAKQVIEVDTPGLCSPNIKRYHYKRAPRPLFPLDDI